MENSEEVSLRTKNTAIIGFNNLTPGRTSGEKHCSKGYMLPCVHRALFTIAKTWKQLKCPSTDEWIKT